MSKQWGHGYYSGLVDATEKGMNNWVKSGRQIEECKQEWTKEVLKIHLIKKNNYYFCQCPFHEEKSPSCSYDAFENKFHCFGCGKQGDGFTLVQGLCKKEGAPLSIVAKEEG